MVRRRTTYSARVARRTRSLNKVEGARLKQAIHVARAKAGITSDMQLALRAGVSYDTLMNWYGGKTVPRGNELNKVAGAANTTVWILQAAYDGRAPDPPPLQDAIGDLVNLAGRLLSEVEAQRQEWAMEREERAAELAGARESLLEVPRGGSPPADPAPAPLEGAPKR
jgi:transcriptional regulator with XRE-family HTH domain